MISSKKIAILSAVVIVVIVILLLALPLGILLKPQTTQAFTTISTTTTQSVTSASYIGEIPGS
jgi:hypothetical protein